MLERTNNRILEISPVIILVEPQLPENIGMAARAMGNFGLEELRLVNPREQFPNEKARAAARKAYHIIDNTILFKDLPTAVSDLSLVFATTARQRNSFKSVKGAVEASLQLRKYAQNTRNKKSGILFGRERYGLSNDEISLADEIVTFPVSQTFNSMNIAQSVLLMSYEWMKSGLETETQTVFPISSFVQAEKATLYGFFTQLEKALDTRGYFRPPERKESMISNLRTVLTRASFAEAEIHLLRGVISCLDRFSAENPRGLGNPRKTPL